MKKQQTVNHPQQNKQIDWNLVLMTGAMTGVAAGLLSKAGAGWFNITIPFAMMIASWWGTNRSPSSYFRNGAIASLIAGMLGWILYLLLDYQTFVNIEGGNPVVSMLQLTVAFLAPMILFVSLLASWLFSRTRLRVMAAQQKAEAAKSKREKIQKNRPKKNFKRK